MFELADCMTIARAKPRGMITFRGDLADKTLRKTVAKVMGLDVPAQGRINHNDGRAAAWMSPDELLLTVPKESVGAALETLAEDLKKLHHLAADVSDARVVFSIDGPHAREVLAKGMPIDLSPEAFQQGQIRRSRLGQVACATWMSGENSFDLIVFASVAEFVENWLQNAARKDSFPMFLTPDQPGQTA